LLLQNSEEKLTSVLLESFVFCREMLITDEGMGSRQFATTWTNSPCKQ